MLATAFLAQLGRLTRCTRQWFQAQSTDRLLQTAAARRFGVEFGMQAELEFRVQCLPATDAGHGQVPVIAMLTEMCPKGGHMLQLLATVGALSGLAHLAVLQLVLGEYGGRGKYLVADETLVFAARIVTALHVLLQLGARLVIAGAIGASQADARLEIMRQLAMRMQLRFAAQILPLAHAAAVAATPACAGRCGCCLAAGSRQLGCTGCRRCGLGRIHFHQIALAQAVH